jgi:hypothetical protein
LKVSKPSQTRHSQVSPSMTLVTWALYSYIFYNKKPQETLLGF